MRWRRWLATGVIGSVVLGLMWWIPVAFGPLTIQSALPLALAVAGAVSTPLAIWARQQPPHIDKPLTAETRTTSGAMPTLWNLAARNPGFVGRHALLADVHRRLSSDGPTVVQALHGLGGIGKTQLAIEYAYRFADRYNVVWWFRAERPELLGEQYTELAVAAGLAGPTTDTGRATSAALRHLRSHNGWLTIFDNAEQPAELREWLPTGPGHVLITSRNPAWNQVAVPIKIDVFTRDESIAMLRSQIANCTHAEANELAEALGDLPLAIGHAAGTIAETGMPIERYCTTLAARAARTLSDGVPATYPVPLAVAIRFAADRLSSDDAAAAQLLTLCAFLGPDPIPLELFAHGQSILDEPLRSVVADELVLRRSVGLTAGYGLARVDVAGVQLHRLTQAVLRDTTPDVATITNQVESLLVSAKPDDGRDPTYWPAWAALLPHYTARDPANSTNPELRLAVSDMVWYLLSRGDTRTACTIAEQLRNQWLISAGADAAESLHITNHLAQAYRDLGKLAEAKMLDEEAHARFERRFGSEDRRTLTSASNLAIDLFELHELAASYDLHKDTLARRRRRFGNDDPATLVSAANLGLVLRARGDVNAARALHDDTLRRRKRVLGNMHPETLEVANHLAMDQFELGDLRSARNLLRDTLERRRQVLGDTHAHTLESARNFAAVQRALGKV